MFINFLRKLKFRLLCDESGMGVIEVILILLVVVGLVIIFRDQISSLASSIFSRITSQANSI